VLFPTKAYFVKTICQLLCAAPIQATDGNFYGTTRQGGNGTDCGESGCGTIFKINKDDKLTTLHSFDFTDGSSPFGGLLQETNGDFYGTTGEGGDLSCNPPQGCGTIFSISTELGPFVSLLPSSAKEGSVVYILGTDLTGVSSISFNGTSAAFTVKSSSEIKTAVPARATTGFVTVTRPSGNLRSNKKFCVKL
jgi:uncharacterized repeat protein (TIGR03803 family)